MADSSSVVLGPKLGKVVYADIGANFPNSLRAFLRAFDALVHATVISVAAISVPPGGPANGDAYIVGAGASGAWAGKDLQLAVWSTQIATTDTNTKVPAWEFYAPAAGWRVYNAADGLTYFYTGSTWIATRSVMTGAGSPEGVVTAPIGSLWTRTDGGASTTLYVKESGAGNTGWIAK
jgi:hypothetical protein